MTDNSSDLSDDIVPEVPQHLSIDRKFAPWHKVRKEYVRKEQWNKCVIQYINRFLIRELQTEGPSEWSDDEASDVPDTIEVSRPLNCLVIPGDDILDVRSLCRDTESIKCYIRYLGFNEREGSDQEGTQVHIANNDVTSLDRIHNNSRVICDHFQSIASLHSQAYKYLKEFGPFHVVNLDLCDSLFPTGSEKFVSYYKALHRILEYQMRAIATPWLLFITSQVAPKEVDASKLDTFCRTTKKNVAAHADFATAMSSVVPTAVFNTDTSVPIDCSMLDEQQLVGLFGVAVGKVLLGFCSTADPKWKMRMLESHIYSINKSRNVSMLSLAFEFKPVTAPPQDSTGLSDIDLPSPTPFDESELATRLVSAVKNISDIDELLEADSGLKAEMMDSSADLLESAGYDREKYVQWVKDGEQPPSR